MTINNKLAFQTGEDDYLGSKGYFPVFWLFLEPGAPELTDDALDSYAMGYEGASAFAALVSERAKHLLKMGLSIDPELSVSKSSLWGNHK